MTTNIPKQLRSLRKFAISSFAALALLSASAPLLGQLTIPTAPSFTKKSEPPKPAVKPRDLRENRREIAASIVRVEQALATFKRENPGQPIPESAAMEMELLKWLDLLYSNHSANLIRKSELETELARVQDETESLRIAPAGERKRYSFLMLDDLRDQLNTETQRRESIYL